MPEMSKTRINTFRIFSKSTTKVKAFSTIMQSEEGWEKENVSAHFNYFVSQDKNPLNMYEGNKSKWD